MTVSPTARLRGLLRGPAAPAAPLRVADHLAGVGRVDQGEPRWLTAATPMENPYCSCKLTGWGLLANWGRGLQLWSLWTAPTVAVG